MFYLNDANCRHATKILPISAIDLQDVFNARGPLFAWLRPHQPIAKTGYSIFIYDLSGNSEGLMKLEQTYAVAGLLPEMRSNSRARTNLAAARNNPPRS
jgi:hypothetical protein